MNRNHVVTQRNDLIEARHNKPLTSREQKIILTMVSTIQPSDEDFKEYRISLKNFSEMLGLKGSTKYSEMKTIVKDLMEKTIEIPREKGGWLLSHWVSSAEYIEGEGTIELTFSPKLKPYLLQLKSQFTSYRLSNILSLNSSYSIRLYELMKKWQLLGRWECSILDLREKLGVIEGTYPRYANLKARVLTAAITEVNEKTDISIEFKEIKKGRSVKRIEFLIKHSVDKEISLEIQETKSNENENNENIRARLNTLTKGYEFDRTYFNQMYQGAFSIWNIQAENELKMLIEYINEEESINNPLGFIMSELKKSWEFHQDGMPVTFANKKASKRKTGREEIIPEWFKNKYIASEETGTVSMEAEKRRELMRELGFSEEEIEAKEKQYV